MSLTGRLARRLPTPLRTFLSHQRDRMNLTMRVIQGRDLWINPTLKCKKLRLGRGDGEWCICPSSIDSSSVVYSFGVGYDISFDLAIIQRFGVQVHAFDPTPLSRRWINTQSTPTAFTYHPWGLAAYDGIADFSLPRHHGVSFTMSSNVDSKQQAKGEVFRFETIRQKLGHEKIDIVKLDIEGAEYDVIDDLLKDGDKINQILIEFHHRLVKPHQGLERTRQAIKMIEDANFSLFYVSPRGLEYCFLRT